MRRRLPTAGLLGRWPWSPATARICEQVDVHVDRAGRQRPGVAPIPPAQTIDVGDQHRLPGLRGRGDLGRLANLALAVAVDLGHRDLRFDVFVGAYEPRPDRAYPRDDAF